MPCLESLITPPVSPTRVFQAPENSCGTFGVAVYWRFDVWNLRQFVYLL